MKEVLKYRAANHTTFAGDTRSVGVSSTCFYHVHDRVIGDNDAHVRVDTATVDNTGTAAATIAPADDNANDNANDNDNDDGADDAAGDGDGDEGNTFQKLSMVDLAHLMQCKLHPVISRTMWLLLMDASRKRMSTHDL